MSTRQPVSLLCRFCKKKKKKKKKKKEKIFEFEMKPQDCKQRDLLNFNRQLEYHQLQQREIKTFKRKNAPRSAVEDRPNRFSRRLLTVRIIILVHILVVCFVKYVCYLCTSLRGEVSFLSTWLLTFYEVVRVAF